MAHLHLVPVLSGPRGRAVAAVLVSVAAHATMLGVLGALGSRSSPADGHPQQAPEDAGMSVQVALVPATLERETSHATPRADQPVAPDITTASAAAQSTVAPAASAAGETEPEPAETRQATDPAAAGAPQGVRAGASAPESGTAAPAVRRIAPRPRTAITPRYPLRARIRGWTGETVVSATIGQQGRIVHLDVAVSSGHHVLDEAALAAVADATFEPGRINGHLARMDVRIGVVFQFEEE